MSKWRIREDWTGAWVVEEQAEIDIFDPGFWKFLGIFICVCLGFLIAISIMLGVSSARMDRQEAKEKARIEAQRKIEASIYDVSSEERDGVIWGEARKEDYYGNEYSGEMREFCSWDNKEMATTFILKNDYKRFTGVIFTRPDQKEELTINFKIYGDGKCLYDSGDLRSTTPAIHLNLDITGVETLRFTAVSSGHEVVNAGVILMDAMVHAN